MADRVTAIALSLSLLLLAAFPSAYSSKFSEFGGTGRILLSETGSTVFEIVVNERVFNVTVIGEGIEGIAFSEEKRALALKSGPILGPIEVDVPKELLGGNFTVFADDVEVDYELLETETLTMLIIDRPSEVELVVIQGTTAIPEFGLIAMAVLFIAMMIMVVLVGRRGILRFNR